MSNIWFSSKSSKINRFYSLLICENLFCECLFKIFSKFFYRKRSVRSLVNCFNMKFGNKLVNVEILSKKEFSWFFIFSNSNFKKSLNFIQIFYFVCLKKSELKFLYLLNVTSIVDNCNIIDKEKKNHEFIDKQIFNPRHIF